MAKLTVLIPTRGRVHRLETLIASFEQTAVSGDAELLFRVDDDDAETKEFLIDRAQCLVVGPRHQGYKSMPKFFNELAADARGDVLMCGNDDMVFKTEGWASILLQKASEYPDGLFDLGVDTLNAQAFPFSTVSRKMVDALGFIWDPRVFWGDIYLRDVMAYFGRNIYVHEVKIEHAWAGFSPDKTYLEQLEPGEHTKDISRRDPTYWFVTHRKAVDEAVAKLQIQLRGVTV